MPHSVGASLKLGVAYGYGDKARHPLVGSPEPQVTSEGPTGPQVTSNSSDEPQGASGVGATGSSEWRLRASRKWSRAGVQPWPVCMALRAASL